MNAITQFSAEKTRVPIAGGNQNAKAFNLNYTCLPSSTAISPNAHVTLAIRSFHTNIKPSNLKPYASDDHGMQLYVSAQVLGIGSLPLHSTTVDTVGSSILSPVTKISNNDNKNENQQIQANSNLSLPTIDMNSHLLYHHFPANHFCCTWDYESGGTNDKNNANSSINPNQSRHRHNILTLPVRYKDLSHDACIKLEIFTSRNIKIGSVLLSLWDEKKRLKMGLQKTKVQLEASSASSQSPFSVTTPNFVNSDDDVEDKEGLRKENNGIENEKLDEKFEACLILDKLSQMERMSSSKKDHIALSNSSESTNLTQRQQPKQQDRLSGQGQLEDLNITINGLHNCNPTQSVPWLDSWTKQYCLNVLTEKNEDEIYDDNDDFESDNEKIAYHPNIDLMQHSSLCFSNGDAYLVVELQQCDLPIVHHEQSYRAGFLHAANVDGNGVSSGGSNSPNGVTSSTVLNGSACGSITALDLSIYNHQYATKENIQHTSKDFSFPVMPNLVHALNESQEMGIKLVQVLDFECINDNPVEDKYRTLQHELLRGLVDPALKPDASERAHLNAIISGTSQHLSREEKGDYSCFNGSVKNLHLSCNLTLLFFSLY